MFDSLEAMLAAQRSENRFRSRRAVCLAEIAKIPVEEALAAIVLLETWRHAIAGGMQDALSKDPALSMRDAAAHAIADDEKSRRTGRSKSVV